MKITQMLVTDDIDGTPDAETQTFAFNGRSFEIDLSDTNAAKLQKALSPFVDVARPLRSDGKPYTSTRRKNNPGANSNGNGPTPAEIRQWWGDNPIHLPTWQARGSIPEAVRTAYEQRDTQQPAPDAAPAPKPRRGRKPKAEVAA